MTSALLAIFTAALGVCNAHVTTYRIDLDILGSNSSTNYGVAWESSYSQCAQIAPQIEARLRAFQDEERAKQTLAKLAHDQESIQRAVEALQSAGDAQ